MPLFTFSKNAVSWYVSFYIHIRFVPKFSNASFCGLYKPIKKSKTMKEKEYG